jgi:hypothetical protein
MARGLPADEMLKDLESDLKQVKRYLWYGNVLRILQVVGASRWICNQWTVREPR